MTVRYALIKHQGEIIKIGADNGFVYCGKCDENILDVIEQIGKEKHEELKRGMAKVNHRLNNFETIWRNRKEYVITLWFGKRYKKNKVKLKDNYLRQTTLEDLERELENDKQKQFVTLMNYKNKVGDFLKEYKPFLDREVLDIYPSTDCYENVDYIIKFEGIEKGEYWTCEEYERGYIVK